MSDLFSTAGDSEVGTHAVQHLFVDEAGAPTLFHEGGKVIVDTSGCIGNKRKRSAGQGHGEKRQRAGRTPGRCAHEGVETVAPAVQQCGGPSPIFTRPVSNWLCRSHGAGIFEDVFLQIWHSYGVWADYGVMMGGAGSSRQFCPDRGRKSGCDPANAGRRGDRAAGLPQRRPGRCRRGACFPLPAICGAFQRRP